MSDSQPVTEALALSTLVKLSAAELNRGNLEQAPKAAALNALRRFSLAFLPEDEANPSAGNGSELSAYEMVYYVVKNSKNIDLKVLWYIFYPYLVVASPFADETLYEETKAILSEKEVLGAVLSSRYRELVYDCSENLGAEGLAGVYVDWYAPYNDFKRGTTDSGDTMEIATYKKLLAGGDFIAVVSGTDRLLAINPYDCDIALLNIAARVSSFANLKNGKKELEETLTEIDEFLSYDINKIQETYLHYYRGLCKLGLTAFGGEVKDAISEFNTCLEITADFELAKFMLKAIAKKTEERQ